MDGFEHGCFQLDLTSGYYRENITVEMHHAALDTGQLISLNQGFT